MSWMRRKRFVAGFSTKPMRSGRRIVLRQSMDVLNGWVWSAHRSTGGNLLVFLAFLSVCHVSTANPHEHDVQHEADGVCDGKETCKTTDKAFVWLNPSYLCEAGPTEQAPRFIDAQRDIGSGSVWKKGVTLQDIMHLTSAMQNCTASLWAKRGVETVDWKRIRSEAPGSWWNSLLSLSLDSISRSESADQLLNTLDTSGWAALHLATQLRLPWAIDKLCAMGVDASVVAR
jgi:hypothetical protein